MALFVSAEGFPRQTSQAVRTLRLSVSGATASFRFENLPPGAYALTVYHDKNSNGQLDKNFLLLPTERYGFSNNARIMMFFPPSFGAARFVVAEAGTGIVVKLRWTWPPFLQHFFLTAPHNELILDFYPPVAPASSLPPSAMLSYRHLNLCGEYDFSDQPQPAEAPFNMDLIPAWQPPRANPRRTESEGFPYLFNNTHSAKSPQP